MSQSFNMMQAVKRRFFAMRNGTLAEQMKNAGAEYRINFGLLQAQIADIARQVIEGTLDERPETLSLDVRAELARSLRDNTSTRESMLIAPLLFPAEMLDKEEAVEWLRACPSTEVADTLCHKLLRNLPEATEICEQVLSSDDATDLQRYGGLRLLLNLLILNSVTKEKAKELALRCSGCDVLMVSRLASQIIGRCEI